MSNRQLMEFLEAAVGDVMKKDPKKIVVAYLDDEDATAINYYRCTYADLQHIGQELINEGTIRLVAANEDRIRELRDSTREEGGEAE